MSGKPIRRGQVISPFGVGSIVIFPGPISLVHAGLDAWPFDEKKVDHREFKIEDERRLARRLGVQYFVQPPDFRIPDKYARDRDDRPNTTLRLPFLRFPLWHHCPQCSRMHLSKAHEIAAPNCTGPYGRGDLEGKGHSKVRTVPVRFIVACANGHMEDFPWVEWLTKDAPGELSKWRPDGIDSYLRLYRTSSLGMSAYSVSAEESNGGVGDKKKIEVVIKRKNLGGVYSNEGDVAYLTGLGIKCSSNNPALPEVDSQDRHKHQCSEQLKVILTGASNLYFPLVASSIYIPQISNEARHQEILDLLEDYDFRDSIERDMKSNDDGLARVSMVRNLIKDLKPELTLDAEFVVKEINEILPVNMFLEPTIVGEFLVQKIKASRDSRLTADMVRTVLESQREFSGWTISPDYLLPLLLRSDRIAEAMRVAGKAASSNDSEGDLESVMVDQLIEEYDVFCKDIKDGQMPRLNLLIRSHSIDEYKKSIKDNFDRISLLHKLRETRVFLGYSRINAPDTSRLVRWELISRERKNWLPGVIVRGEGIFLKFKDEAIDKWLKDFGSYHEQRLSFVNKYANEFREARGQKLEIKTPDFVLIHTLAHLIINELVYECGYGSSSLKERTYSCRRDGDIMNGLLIYTAAGDTDGSMGGLVEMGRPGRLERVIENAILRARWCSSDPVCIESKGQGPSNCNLAACHSCALLPETACQHMNRFLDRGVLIGTLDNPSSGFF